MNFLKVLWSDLSNIFRNRFVMVSVIAIIMIPLIYGGLYLAAFWDPYGKTENLPVAVVNLDKGAMDEEKRVNYGNDIVDNLKNNNDLAWKFVNSKKEAEEGLKGDKYYAMMVIPSDFSKRLMDVDKGKLEKPQLLFVANKKKNYVVGLISDKASKAIKQDVGKGIMDNFTVKIFDSLYELRDGMEAAVDGTSQIKDGVTDLKDKVPVMADGINKLYDGSATLNDKLKDASEGSNKLRDGVGTLKDKMPDLVDGVNKLYKGTGTLDSKMQTALDGSEKLRDGSIALNDKLPDLSKGVDALNDGAGSIRDGLGEVNDKMPKFLDGVSDLRDGASEIRGGLRTARDGAQRLYVKDENGNVKQDDGLPALKNGAESMKNSVADGITTKLKTPDKDTGIKPISKMIAIVSGSDQSILKGMMALNQIIQSGNLPLPEDSKKAWNTDLNDIIEFNNALIDLNSTDSKDSINRDLNIMGVAFNGQSPAFNDAKLPRISSDLANIADVVKGYPGFSQSVQLQTVYGTLIKLSQGVTAFNSDSSIVELKQTLKLYQGSTDLSNHLSDASSGVGALTDGLNRLYEGSDKLYNGLDTLYDKSKDLQNGTEDLYTGSKNIKDGLQKFQGTVPGLINGVSQLSDGNRDLSDGLSKIKDSTKELNEKVGELNQKVPDLQQGVYDLYDGTTDLSDGLLKLYDGSGKLKDGIKTLKDKMPDLEDGANKLYEGISQLNDKLKEGAEKLSDKLVQSGKAMGTFISEPVKLQDKPLFDVKKYGEGMAPYFISLALWVGALMMFFVITEKVNLDKKVGSVSVVLGKYLTYGSVGVLQAILISFVVTKIGLQPTNLLAYYSFNIFLSLVFVAIIQNFIFLLGDAGRLVAVIVLVLQLTSSSGTFPGELLPKFFKTIGPFLPFTYSIAALREINCGIDSAMLTKDVTILAGYMIVFLTLSVLLKGPIENMKNKSKGKKENNEQLDSEETVIQPNSMVS